jgi:GT2 family glycosyltransferase
VCVGQRFVDDRGETTQLRMPSASGDVTEVVLRGATLGLFSTLMVRADVIEAVGFPDERFPAWQDREWHVRLSQEGDYEAIREPLAIRHIGSHGRINDDYDGHREAGRLYSDKYRSFAARYGWATERKFAANVYGGVAGTALAAGRYDDCARYSLRALGNDPRSVRGLARLVVGIGGPRVHELVRSARRRYHRLREPSSPRGSFADESSGD